MNLKIKKRIAKAVGYKPLADYDVSEKAWDWADEQDLHLAHLSKKALGKLETLLAQHRDTHGVGVLLKDIATWRLATEDAGNAKARTVEHFCSLLRQYVGRLPLKHLYERVDDDVWLPYFVDKIEYRPAEKSRDNYHPAYTRMHLVWEEFGGQKDYTECFYEEDCRAMAVAEALARKGYVPETPELRATYIGEATRFSEIVKQVGQQYYAVGTGTDDMDGNPEGRGGSWYWSKSHTIQLVNEGQPTRAVVDVFYEDPASNRESNRVYVESWFWHNFKAGLVDDEDNQLDESTEETRPTIEIPIHPMAAVFDLNKHLRLRVHVNYLTPYVYDDKLADKLVLAPELKSLVHMLIEHKTAGFRDIIKGKAGGAVVLLAGEPGTGKTLTAEVYAEAEARALYSIQCSQLGTNPSELEDELLKAFARARRWNAVMLLDEADVYVHERGDDLQQNAIVGVFLRVLEYQNSVLFLTTNRPDDVDDAIASRCVAKLKFSTPTAEEQWKIWRILADNTGAEISNDSITAIVFTNPQLTGRDVKNLLKLAMLVRPNQPITPEAIEFVKQFKPAGESK